MFGGVVGGGGGLSFCVSCLVAEFGCVCMMCYVCGTVHCDFHVIYNSRVKVWISVRIWVSGVLVYRLHIYFLCCISLFAMFQFCLQWCVFCSCEWWWISGVCFSLCLSCIRGGKYENSCVCVSVFVCIDFKSSQLHIKTFVVWFGL